MNSVAVLAMLVTAHVVAAQSAPYGIGHPATQADVDSKEILVGPDGAGLPAGRGTVAQGQTIFVAQCARCHGDSGQGIGEYPALVGGQGTLATAKPKKTVGSYWPYATTVWDYIHRAMPYDRPGALSVDETYAVTAYVLHMNGIVPATAVLDARTLPQVRMPNRDGFVGDPRPDIPRNP